MMLYFDVNWDNGIDGESFEEIWVDTTGDCDIIKAIKERFGSFNIKEHVKGERIVIEAKSYGLVYIYYPVEHIF